MQLTWSAMAPERCVVGVGTQARTVEATPPVWLHQRGLPPRKLSRLPGGPGAVVIDGLVASTTYEVWVAPVRTPPTPHAARRVVGSVTTLAPPPGRLLARFASLSDLHVGERAFGVAGRIQEGGELGGPSALVCLRAAVTEARGWGAELMVARGDLTRSSRTDQFATAARTMSDTGLPCLGVLGNHDVRRRADGPGICAAHGLRVTDDVTHHDLPGLRLVVAHSPMVSDHRGDLPDARIAEIVERCAEAPPRPTATPSGRPGPAALILHHPLTTRRLLSAYPPGVPPEQSARLVAALRAANPSVVVLAGHRHRNRRYPVGGITVSELGSTKDYPGVWAGYAVHEGGISQVIRRIADPHALAWTEATGRGLAGLWAHWAPGRLEDRCWVQPW